MFRTPQNRFVRKLPAIVLSAMSMGRVPALGQWVEFTDETNTTLIISPISVLDPFEKDIATADLNNDGWEDMVVVRKVRFSTAGAKTDILLMNEQGVLVNRTAELAPQFLQSPTDARDVFLADIDSDGWTDVIIANTFEQQPKLYRNLGNDGNDVWLGLADESFRFPVIAVTGPLQFCALWADDVTGDGATDIYFNNYGGAAAGQAFDVDFDVAVKSTLPLDLDNDGRRSTSTQNGRIQRHSVIVF